MQFTLSDCVTPSPWESFLWMCLTLALPVGLPLFFWLRRSTRDAFDVLRASPALPSGGLPRSLGLAEWVLPAATILLPQVLATAVILHGLFTPDSILAYLKM